jgi:hypothetical protein
LSPSDARKERALETAKAVHDGSRNNFLASTMIGLLGYDEPQYLPAETSERIECPKKALKRQAKKEHCKKLLAPKDKETKGQWDHR